MKSNLLTGLSCLAAAMFLLYACQKQLSPTASTPVLNASATDAAIDEKIILSIVNAPAGTHLIWQSTPAVNALFSLNGEGSANVSFSKPGTYIVTCYIVDAAGQDSIPNYDTTHYRYDTVPNYPPPPPVYDSAENRHDTTPHNPRDTAPAHAGDTTTYYPHDTVSSHPNDTVSGIPDTTQGYPHDTTIYLPQDSAYYPYDSTEHNQYANVLKVISITITVH
ncbi:MAG TPA: hypothetical protein VHB48_18735 [Chitinophagaceae bacterium]|nr:hypothetical protein [Chitinophagaceae bacterium]